MRPGRDRFTIKRVVKRQAGVASYPVLRLGVILEGPTPATNDDWTLELKEAAPGEARTIVAIERHFNPPPDGDPFFGWALVGTRELIVRRLSQERRHLSARRLATSG